MAEMEMDMELGNDILTLTDEEGNEHEFEVACAHEVDGKRYLGLVPLFEESAELLEDPGELVILEVIGEGEEEYLAPIESEDEFDKVAAVLVELLEEEYDFIDGEE